MAFSASKNQILFERMKNAAVAFQNLREECVRLRNIKSQEARGHEDHDDTDIATVAEFDLMISFCTDFNQFCDGDGGVQGLQVARWGWLLPFIDTTPA